MEYIPADTISILNAYSKHSSDAVSILNAHLKQSSRYNPNIIELQDCCAHMQRHHAFTLYLCCICWNVLNMHLIYLLYLMECFKYAFNILVESEGIYPLISEASRPT